MGLADGVAWDRDYGAPERRTVAGQQSGVSAIEAIEKAMEGVTPGPWGQFHPSYSTEAIGAPFSEWDTSHDISAIVDGKRIKRVATFKHAADAAYLDACNPVAMREVLALARQAEALQRENAEKDALQKIVNAVLTWAEQRCPCNDDQPNPCPLCGASVENLEPCKSAENTIPRHLLTDLRRASARSSSKETNNEQ